MTDLASILSDRLAEGAFALVLILLMLQVGVLLVTLRLRFSIPRLLRTALPLLLCFLPFAVFGIYRIFIVQVDICLKVWSLLRCSCERNSLGYHLSKTFALC